MRVSRNFSNGTRRGNRRAVRAEGATQEINPAILKVKCTWVKEYSLLYLHNHGDTLARFLDESQRVHAIYQYNGKVSARHWVVTSPRAVADRPSGAGVGLYLLLFVDPHIKREVHIVDWQMVCPGQEAESLERSHIGSIAKNPSIQSL